MISTKIQKVLTEVTNSIKVYSKSDKQREDSTNAILEQLKSHSKSFEYIVKEFEYKNADSSIHKHSGVLN